MLKNCPDPVDEQAIHFKLQCRLKVFENNELDSFSVPHNLIACASRYGLLFVGTNSPNLQAIQCSTLANYSPKDKDISDYPHRNLALPSTPRHVSVNCDHTIVAVVIEQDKCPVAIFYDVLSFYKQQIQPLTTVRLSANPGTFVTEVNWNPALPPFFTACKSDGSIGIYELKGVSVEINEIPPAAEASTFCWSPKGKQIAVGSKKGTITQYKPDLKAVRMINAPPLGEPVSLISLQWISNYQFIGIYQPKTDDAQAKLIVVDAPKTGETVYINYDDVCYSGSSRIPQFFMILQSQWNILMVASSNSAELAVLGLTSPDSWTQWMISDSSRAELPLSPQRQETLPVGLSIDISNTKPYAWGESTLAPPPYVLMLSHQGVLCIFNFVNLKDVPPICTPPDPIQDQSGLSEFSSKPTTASKEKPINEPSQQPSTEVPKKSQIQLPAEVPPKPTTSPALQINPLSFSFSTAPVTPTTQSKSLFSFTTPTQTQSGLFGEKSQQSQSLFSGQATLTPIKPQTVASPMFDQISITPINKTQPSSGKNLVDERYTSIFSALNTPQSSAIIPTQVKPIILSTTNKTSNPPEFPVSNLKINTQSKQDNVAILKPESSTAAKPDQTFVSKSVAPSTIKSEVAVVSKPVSEPSKVETEAILQNMIKEECRSLEAELTAMTQKGKRINVNVGSEEDKIELLDIIKNLEEFLEEITEISAGEYSEIHTLKQNVVLSWAWYEEALSRYNTSKNDMMKLLIKSQPLDSATEKRYSDIKKLIYYIESQLLQVSRALDEQWDKFQDYVKKTYKVQTPTMEAIYQAMVRQNGILQKQGYFVKDISNRLKKKQQISGSTLLLSVDNISLEDELKKLQVETHDDKYQLYKRAVMQSKKLSSVKTKKLHALLKNREVVHITSIKSFIPSETFQSPNKRLSLLGAKMSPVPKFLEPKQIDFSQSTPYRNFTPVGNSTNSTISELQPIKPLNFKKLDDSKTIEVPVTNNPPAFSFTPTTRSQLTSSNLPSAFVSTAQNTSVSKEQNLSPNITQKIPTEISNPKTTTKQVSFSPNVGVGMQKPVSSIPGFGFSGNTSFPAFSFGTTPNKTITSTANTFLNKGNEVSTPTENTGTNFPALSLTKSNTTKANDTPTLFGSAMPKTVATSSSFIQTTEKPKTETNVPTRNVLSLKPSTTTTTIPPSNTFSFAANTANSTGTTSASPSFQFGTTPKATATSIFAATSIPATPTSIFAATSIPATTMSLFTSQTVSNAPTSSSSIASTTKVSSSESAVSKQVITCTAATSAIPAPTTTVIKTTSMTSQSITTNSTSVPPTAALSTSSSLFSSPTTTSGGSVFGAAATTSSFSFINSGSSTLFGNATTTGSNNVPSAGFKPTTTSSLFSAISSLTTVTTTPLFGTSTSTTVPAISTVATPATSTTVAAVPTVGTSATSTTVVSVPTVGASATSTTAAASPLFGKSTSVSAPLLFGTPLSTTTSVTSIFGSSASNTVSAAPVMGTSVSKAASAAPIFGTTTSTPGVPISSTSSTVCSASTFGTSAAPTSVCGSSTFGTSTSVQSPSSFFGSGVSSTTTKSTPSVFGSTTTSSAFEASTGTSSSSIFGSNASTVKSTSGTIFGSNTSNPLFGSNSAVSSPTSIFSNIGKAESTSSAPSIFGQSSAPQATAFAQSPSISSSASIFGTPTTTQTSIFGAATTTTTQSFPVGGTVNQGSIFGSAATTSASVQPSIFGSAATSAANTVFGSSTSSPSIFATTTAPNSSPFSQPATNTFGSAFGGTSSSPSLPTSSSVFGAPATFGSSTGSIFGSTPTTTSGSIFGTSTSGSSFGAVTSGSIFGSTAASSFSFASAAGTTGESALNFGSLNVNNATTTAGSVFGGGSIFGSAATASNPNPFGKTPEKTTFGSGSNLFGNTTTSSPFGSNTAFGASNQSTFGSTGFGQQPQQQQSAFGQSTFGSSSFGSSQPGPFSGGGAGVGQSGFGSPTGFQKPASAFGSPPVFGGSPAPAFGGSPSFGGAPAFGAAPSFGSPPKIFGSNTPTAAFGSASTGSPGFGNLANQETIGFGNLAKQAANSPSSGFSGNSSFSSWR